MIDVTMKKEQKKAIMRKDVDTLNVVHQCNGNLTLFIPFVLLELIFLTNFFDHFKKSS